MKKVAILLYGKNTAKNRELSRKLEKGGHIVELKIADQPDVTAHYGGRTFLGEEEICAQFPEAPKSEESEVIST